MKPWYVMMACLLPLMAQAASPQIDPALLKDYIGLTKVMRAHGLDPIRTNWMQLDALCQGVRHETNQTPFNQCRFQVAYDGMMYDQDASLCRDKSIAVYPKSLLLTSAERQLMAEGKLLIAQPQLSSRELKAGRRVVYDECMRDRGWKNPNNYLEGRAE